MTAPEPFTTDALWSAGEVREQSQQVAGQLDVWDVLAQDCCTLSPDVAHWCDVDAADHAAGRHESISFGTCRACRSRDTLHAELRPCAACNAESGAPCDPLCIGLAAELDRLEP